MTGKEISSLMRKHRCTMRDLKARTGITLKRIRYVRQHGVFEPFVVRDWKQAITGVDPGPQ